MPRNDFRSLHQYSEPVPPPTTLEESESTQFVAQPHKNHSSYTVSTPQHEQQQQQQSEDDDDDATAGTIRRRVSFDPEPQLIGVAGNSTVVAKETSYPSRSSSWSGDANAVIWYTPDQLQQFREAATRDAHQFVNYRPGGARHLRILHRVYHHQQCNVHHHTAKKDVTAKIDDDDDNSSSSSRWSAPLADLYATCHEVVGLERWLLPLISAQGKGRHDAQWKKLQQQQEEACSFPELLASELEQISQPSQRFDRQIALALAAAVARDSDESDADSDSDNDESSSSSDGDGDDWQTFPV
eukprot:CAMPEP_0168755492 /NCGR_PEP_ID=MMETSP0724-20121128/20098_1 /TAXON_ID=265536 /ORGANISM="Amphiprora sp., Strain CCMP467" /LENGTH=297 /DNA_ID=CAMNT_0008804111 /DNA_START=10 /DNA_END=903 /DNA_ORIENTATION=+